MKKLVLTSVLLLAAGFAFIQAQDNAVAIYNMAREAHGGRHFDDLKTYHETGALTYFENNKPDGTVQFETFIDIPNNRTRLEFSIGSTTLYLTQIANGQAWTWQQKTGVVAADKFETENLKNYIPNDIFALRYPAQELTDIKIEGIIKKPDLTGTIISFKHKEITSKVVIDSESTLVASYRDSDKGETIVYYKNWHEVNGIYFPQTITTKLGDQTLDVQESTLIETNVQLTDQLFTEPK